MDRLKALWMQERPAFPLWVPVLIGIGVQIWFALTGEPPLWLFPVSLGAALALTILFWRGDRMRLFCIALLLLALGFSAAGLRARMVAAPVLGGPIDAVVEGVVREITRTATGRPRLVLDRPYIFSVASARTPARVQVSLQKELHLEGITPGSRVSVYARLGPPGGPSEPGGFDFRRNAWFKSLGGIGFARGAPVVIGADEAPGLFRQFSILISSIRASISAGIRAQLPGEAGAFAAAVTVGDRAAVSKEATEALRHSNLAHLLAISGLHVGLVTGLVFGASRLFLAAIPYTAQHWRTKQIAAFVALLASTGYMLLSGASVATERAWIMAMVALVAIMIGRPALTLRALAVAAIAILIFRPESLTQVGFQMSFAATAAIIAGFDFAREKGLLTWLREGGRGRQILGYLLALAGTSLLAGLATAPFSAFHFNRVANYGLIANLAAVPIMGFWVAPFALISAALAPLGLENAPLTAMGWGIDAIMVVARFVSGLEGATRGVAAAPDIVLTLISLGGLGLCLGRSLMRWSGAALILAGLLIWLTVDTRPELLIAPEGRLMGLRGPEGRALDHPKTQSYTAGAWLTRDGDDADQKTAAARGGSEKGYVGSVAILSNGWRVANVLAKKPSPVRLEKLCEAKTLLIVPRARGEVSGACQILVGPELLRLGAFSVIPEGSDIRIHSSAEAAGDRLWTRNRL